MREKIIKPLSMEEKDIQREIESLLINFQNELQTGELRSKVLSLIPIIHYFRDLGKSLIPQKYRDAARERIKYYFLKYPRIIISGDELLVVSGIQDYPRRVRELRVQFGWAIASGVAIREMNENGNEDIPEEFSKMGPDDYILLNENEDRDAAHRWNLANTIRRESASVMEKIIKYLKENVGKEVTNEELRYVAGNKTEWARRVRELRTEHGWPIVTKTTGRPDLAVGIYILEAKRQSPEHDRKIPDELRGEVLRRDNYSCRKCGWSNKEWDRSNPKHLELHHIRPHVKGGENKLENLMTLCTSCHDLIHKKNK